MGEGRETVINLCAYKIQNRRNRGIESDLRGMEQSNLDLGVF